jgi:hypothetical protein
VGDIDTAVVVDGLKVLDPEWPIREADIFRHRSECRLRARQRTQVRTAVQAMAVRDRLSVVFQRISRASNPSGTKNFMELESIEATPPSRTVTFAPGKDAREMALVNKTAELRNIGEFLPRIP